jgi:hypothetical protein
MLIFYLVIVCAIVFLAIVSAFLLWKYEGRAWFGFLPILAIPVWGMIILAVFSIGVPSRMDTDTYIRLLYSLGLIYFLAQFVVVYKKTRKRKMLLA